ncbi:MAG: iron-sulfur cluster insertion protein ErpA [Pseudomonadota bacterium]
MSEVKTVKPIAVNFTENAAKKVMELIAEEGNLALNLRVYITGGGCSGFQYGFAFEEDIKSDDQIISRTIDLKAANDEDEDEAEGGESGEGSHTVNLLIDPMSYQYLIGAEIDYVADIEGERFVIRNPNAQTTCGCGSSFSV